jgi:homotetrameric cytidine deaminase
MPLLLRGVPQNNNFFPSPDYVQTKLIDAIHNEFSGDHNELIKSTLSTIKKRPLSMQIATNSQDRNNLAREAAKQLKDPNGPRVAVFELDGFDTHTAQGGNNGAHADELEEVNNIVKILYKNLGSSFDNTLILTLTEFGRTIKQNGGFGTEHGYGSAILMAGGLLKKSQVYTDWPGLKKKNLFEGRDLNSTIDARAVYNSAMSICFNRDNAHVPYSKFKVGAAFLTEDNSIIAGCNVENAAYPQSQCAEASAIGNLVAKGFTKIKEVVVIGSGDLLCSPCGGCRQRLREFAALDVNIHMCNVNGHIKTSTLEDLLPDSFGPENL